MRPKKHDTTRSGDLFRARLDQIINLKHELAQLAGAIDWDWIDGEIAPLYSEKGRPGIETRFAIGLLLLKHIYGLSDEGVCERWVYDPYFQHFTGEEFFQHAFPHERSDLSHWRKRLGDKLELLLAESLRVAHVSGALRTQDLARVTVDTDAGNVILTAVGYNFRRILAWLRAILRKILIAILRAFITRSALNPA